MKLQAILESTTNKNIEQWGEFSGKTLGDWRKWLKKLQKAGYNYAEVDVDGYQISNLDIYGKATTRKEVDRDNVIDTRFCKNGKIQNDTLTRRILKPTP